MCAKAIANPYGEKGAFADSIMDKVIFFAPLYESVVDDFQAELYIKGRVDVKKRNFAIRYLPTMFRLKKNVREYMMETVSDLHYSAPNVYTQKVKAVMGTTSELWKADGRLLEYFHINIYSTTFLRDKLISPLAPNARKYYNYHVDSIIGGPYNREFKIRFLPKFKSFQLVGGYMIVSEDIWSVREIRFTGRSEMFYFDSLLKMGKVGALNEFLPTQCDVSVDFRFLGNEINGSYVAILNYKDVRQHAPSLSFRKAKKDKYNLTELYTISRDSNTYLRDTISFDTLRPVALSIHEKELYKNFNTVASDTTFSVKKKKSFWGTFGDALVNYYTVDLNEFGNIRCTPLINPFMFGYSARNGISYRQRFRYNCPLANDKLLSIVPGIGYNFKLKQFYWNLRTEYLYYPSKQGSLELELGNGSSIYSSAVLDELKVIPDSIFDFNKVNLKYYKDLFVKLRHSWEIVNGLSLDVSLVMHRRSSGKTNDYSSIEPGEGVADGLKPVQTDGVDKLYNIYHVNYSFAPGLRLSWTPGQYYYMEGKRKMNLYSKFPTISLDWERGLKNVLPNSSNYERFEVDVQYNIPLGLMRSLYARLGWGAFTRQDQLYFVDFANFRPFDLPTGWNDDLGGIFHLLDRRWYNASRDYFRGHLTYESPFLLLPHINRYTQYVLNERIYLSALVVPHLKPYIEIGYGIGTHVFDFGAFVSFSNWEYKEIGVKFTFELFNR